MNFSNVKFVRVLEAKEHHKESFVSVLLCAEETTKTGKTLLLGGDGITRKRYAIQVIQKDTFNKLNLKEGSDFTSALLSLGGEFSKVYGAGARINAREITESVYQQLSEDKRKAYQPKLIPANAEKGTPEIPLYHNGERIYMKFEYVANSDKNSEDNVLSASRNSSKEVAKQTEAIKAAVV